MSIRPALIALGALAMAASGCGSGNDNVVRTGGTVSTSLSITAPSSSPSVKRNPVITITPDTNLRDGQTVLVTGKGFSPGEQLQVVECAQKHQKTAPGDCNLNAMASIRSDASGQVRVRFQVRKGPFGTGGVVCSAKQPCIISVTQASLTPEEEDDAPIRFAGA